MSSAASTSTSPNPTIISFTRAGSQSTGILQSSVAYSTDSGGSLALKRGYTPTPPRPHSRRASKLGPNPRRSSKLSSRQNPIGRPNRHYQEVPVKKKYAATNGACSVSVMMTDGIHPYPTQANPTRTSSTHSPNPKTPIDSSLLGLE